METDYSHDRGVGSAATWQEQLRLAVMLIAEAQSTFCDFLGQRGKDPTRLLPEELLTLGFAFYESTRATDALPADDASFGDALLFQWGTREALVGYYGECYYFDLTRQFISQIGEDDDAIFQLTCQLQYELSADLRAVEAGNRWCSSVMALPEFKLSPWATPPSRRSRDGLPERSNSTSQANDGWSTTL
jgi:hypothetical protein